MDGAPQDQNLNSEWTYGSSIRVWSGDDCVEFKRAGHPPDYSTLFTGGLTGNLAVTYLGSHELSYTETNGTLNIHVWNYSTVSSATHPPVIGYTNWWDKNIGKPLDNYFSKGPMSQTSQVFDLHQNLNEDCNCKK
jgi:hypothetical protein